MLYTFDINRDRRDSLVVVRNVRTCQVLPTIYSNGAWGKRLVRSVLFSCCVAVWTFNPFLRKKTIERISFNQLLHSAWMMHPSRSLPVKKWMRT